MGLIRWAAQAIEKQCYKCNYEYKQADSVIPPKPVEPEPVVIEWPRWYELAKGQIGQAEITGDKHNPRILAYHQETALKATTDEVAWCSAFICWAFESCGIASTRNAAARSWLNFGKSLTQPKPGCVVVFWRVARDSWEGHVGLYVRETDTEIIVLGGNQDNKVCEKAYSKNQLLGYRWPDVTPIIRTKGIDVSHYQPNVDWVKHIADGVKFAFIKATEGVSFVDNCFEKHWSDMKTHNIIRGAYHYFRPKYDAIEQARHFWLTVGRLEKSDMPLVCDFEAHDNQSKAVIKDQVLVFLKEIERLSGRKPIVYTGDWFIDEFAGVIPELADYPLWVSDYRGKIIELPRPWNSWDFWQYTSKPIDSNYFNGSLDDLKKRFTIA